LWGCARMLGWMFHADEVTIFWIRMGMFRFDCKLPARVLFHGVDGFRAEIL
jgi:hypothetical protein